MVATLRVKPRIMVFHGRLTSGNWQIYSMITEVLHFFSQVDSFKAKEESLLLVQNENALLRAKLQEAGVTIDLITGRDGYNHLSVVLHRLTRFCNYDN